MQRFLPALFISDCINYLRDTPCYLEKMRKLPEEYPQIYKYFQEGKCLVKTNAGCFKSTVPDMKLQKTKQYLIFRKQRHTKMYLVRRRKFSQTLLNLLKKLVDTLDYQSDKTEVTGLAAVIDFMSVVHETGFKKHPKIQK